ncbi:hypothetical protein VE00_08857 [Pseudogymnoascus sp. WSF 3629]|nr:hypothetical protein VE00_08857 [Pseudogymnoascus sp. WSF 3629]
MLLTQSQVSVFISVVTIFFFTLALFLSGYVLQQKTLTNLRAAIKPSHLSTPSDSQFYTPSSHDAPSPIPNISPRDSSQLIEVTTAPHTNYLDFITSYLPSSGKPTPPRRGGGVVNTANKMIHRWITRVRGEEIEEEEEEDESIPMEQLSRAARRRRIKAQIRTIGDGEDVDFSRVYRPRKRVW